MPTPMNPPIIRRAPSGIMATARSREIVCKAHSPVPQRPRSPWRRCQSAHRRRLRPSGHTLKRAEEMPARRAHAARDRSASHLSQGLCRYRQVALNDSVGPAQSWPIRPDRSRRAGVRTPDPCPSYPHVHGRLLRAAAHSAHDRGRDVGGKRSLRLPGPRQLHRQADHLLGLWTLHHDLCCLLCSVSSSVAACVYLLGLVVQTRLKEGRATCDRRRDVPDPPGQQRVRHHQALCCAGGPRGKRRAQGHAPDLVLFRRRRRRGCLGAPARARDDHDRVASPTTASSFLPRRSRSADASSMSRRNG